MSRYKLKRKYENLYYVYLHIDPNTKQVVYIGKGTKDRAWQFHNRKDDHKSWALSLIQNGLEPIVKLIHVFKNEEDAYIREEMLISFFRSINIELFNVMPGGRGAPSGPKNHRFGVPHTKEHRLKNSLAHLGVLKPDISEVTRKRMIGNTIKKGTKSKPETIRKIVKSLTGNHRRSLKVFCVNNGKTYGSIKDAWTELSLDERSVFRVLKGEYSHTKGYKFTYV